MILVPFTTGVSGALQPLVAEMKITKTRRQKNDPSSSGYFSYFSLRASICIRVNDVCLLYLFVRLCDSDMIMLKTEPKLKPKGGSCEFRSFASVSGRSASLNGMNVVGP